MQRQLVDASFVLDLVRQERPYRLMERNIERVAGDHKLPAYVR